MVSFRAYLHIKVIDLTRIDSMIVFNPNYDIVEDRRRKQGFNFKEISTVMTRSKVIIFLILYLQNVDRIVLYFDYPLYSFAWYIVRITIYKITILL